MTARRLLLEKVTMVRRLYGVVLLATLMMLAFGPIGAAQQLDLSSALVANPATSAALGGQQQLNLSASACGPAGQHEQMKVFVDEHHNAWYRATVKGLNLTGDRGLRVIGGLLPRWNLAAQMGSSGGTAPGNTVNAEAWATPNPQIGASPYSTPRVRVVWVPTLLAACPTTP